MSEIDDEPSEKQVELFVLRVLCAQPEPVGFSTVCSKIRARFPKVPESEVKRAIWRIIDTGHAKLTTEHKLEIV